MRVEADAGERMRKFSFHKLGERGQIFTEFAFALPLLLLILVGTVMFGIALNNYIALTFATNAGAQLLSVSRGQTSDPCQTASQALEQAAPNLNPSNLTFTITLGGTAYSGNCTCKTPPCSCTSKGNSCTSGSLVQGQTAQVQANYPCNLQILTFNPACNLSAQTAVFIQ